MNELQVKLFDEVQHVLTDRAEKRGQGKSCVKATAKAWQAYIEAKGSRQLNADDVCNMMVIHKTIRDAKGADRDNDIDVIGYTGLKYASE